MTQEDILRVKGLGFLRNRGTDCFSGRMVAPGTVFTSKNFEDMAYIASTYGNGKLIATTRLSIEIPGIPFEKIDEAITYAASKGLYFGGTGAKIRPITACKGTTCVFGNYDTQAMAKKLHNEFYLGWGNVKLPHKFKISVGGCPNSCMKPSLNDFGVEGRRTAPGQTMYQIYIGGTWGKSTRMGTPLSKLVSEEQVYEILKKTILWYKENGNPKERLGSAIDRVGIEAVEEALFSNELLCRKDEILSK